MKKVPTSRVDKLLGSMGYGSRTEISRLGKVGVLRCEELQGAQATPACDDFRATLAIGQARDGLDQASGPKACGEFFNLGLRHLLAGIEGRKGEHSQREAGFACGDGVDLRVRTLSRLIARR